MRLPFPLIKGTLLKRYKRFLADVTLESGEVVTAHCANSGSMLTVNEPGMTVWLSKAPEGSQRKLGYSWELVESQGALVGIYPAKCNDIVDEALQKGLISELKAYQTWRREVKYAQNSRIDFLLTQEGLPDCYLEIKGVQMRRGDFVEFPDAKTARGVKHLAALMEMKAAGHRAVVLYCAQREDGLFFKTAEDIDPDYARQAKEARAGGVEMLCYGCHVCETDITLQKPLPMIEF